MTRAGGSTTPDWGVGHYERTAQLLLPAARVLVDAAAPQAPAGFAWHDESAVSELFSRHGMSAAPSGHHELVFTATSPAAYLTDQLQNHPLAVQGFDVLTQKGQAEQARARLLQVLDEHNEDESGFRSTSRYVVFVAQVR